MKRSRSASPRPPSPHPGPCEGERFDAAKRRSLLDDGKLLPFAFRAPPIRCVTEFVLTSLADKDGQLKGHVRAWMENPDNEPALRRFKMEYGQKNVRNWPSNYSPTTFYTMLAHTLFGLQSAKQSHTYAFKTTYHFVPYRLKQLHRVRVESGFDGLCAVDHHTGKDPGPWFQLHLLYRLTLKLEEIGVLDTRPRTETDCPICFARVEGAGQPWYHLEPCRHWLCSSCGDEYMQARAENKCPQCRSRIVMYVHAQSGV